MLDRRISLGAAACGVALAAPLAAGAQNGTENYYYPPKIATFGKSSLPIAGPGKVVVKVLVRADGTFAVQGVIASTNHGDDATALDIAKHSKYHPAARGLAKKPILAFYDFSVDFTGSGASGSAGSDATPSALIAPETAMRAGKYAEAESSLDTYLQAHPGDQKALLDLGETQVFLNDFAAAAGTFDKVTTIPDNVKGAAERAYSEASTAATKAKATDEAVAFAKKAVALEPGVYSYNALGTAEHAAGDDVAALADLQKAHDAATSLKNSDRATIDVNLISILYDTGKDDEAKPLVAEVNALSPGDAGLQIVTANRAVKHAQAADAAGKLDEGESDWEAAALAAPSQAAAFYAHAASDEINKKTGADLAKAKGYTDKGLAADPNNAELNYFAGYVLAKQGKKTDALTYLNKADASAKAGNDSGLTSGIESLIKQLNAQ
jgi:thioredoxin-like negative regulator of GroEL